MPAIANKSVPSVLRSESVLSGLTEIERVALQMALLSLAARIGHVWPNLAAIVGFVRKVHNVSQTEMGANRAKKTNQPIFRQTDGKPVKVDNSLKMGWFSLIANIEQGGRKTDIPAAFVTYLSAVSGLSESVINDAIAEDAALSTASAESAPVEPDKTETVEKAVKSQSPRKTASTK